MTLEWQSHPNEPESSGGVTKCGRYAVSTLGGGLWQAWKIAPGSPWFAPLGLKLPSEAEAKALCEKDRT